MLNPPGPAKNNLRELEATSSASATTIAPCHLAAVGTTDFLSLVVLEYGDWIRKCKFNHVWLENPSRLITVIVFLTVMCIYIYSMYMYIWLILWGLLLEKKTLKYGHPQ